MPKQKTRRGISPGRAQFHSYSYADSITPPIRQRRVADALRPAAVSTSILGSHCRARRRRNHMPMERAGRWSGPRTVRPVGHRSNVSIAMAMPVAPVAMPAMVTITVAAIFHHGYTGCGGGVFDCGSAQWRRPDSGNSETAETEAGDRSKNGNAHFAFLYSMSSTLAVATKQNLPGRSPSVDDQFKRRRPPSSFESHAAQSSVSS
jgi:hypothetical protein